VRIKEEVVLLVEQKCEKIRGNKSFLKEKKKSEEKNCAKV
jgi:hypothetical protein